MRIIRPFIPWPLVTGLLLGACSSPPKPPTVDESQKRPVNSQEAIELQLCKNDLQNTRILATESGRLADTAAATLANMATRQKFLEATQPPAETAMRANALYTVRFDFGSTRVVIPTDIAAILIDETKAAPLVLLRGRTDGSKDSPSAIRIARDRAAAVRDYLVAAGVNPARIRTTYQPTGDHIADNLSPSGRGLNRRVEIELYRTLPAMLNARTAAQP